jgi:hypothetical protein
VRRGLSAFWKSCAGVVHPDEAIQVTSEEQEGFRRVETRDGGQWGIGSCDSS